MEKLITKKELEELKKIKGETRGIPLKAELNYILQKEGKEGLAKLEQAMVDSDYVLNLKDIISTGFYPLWVWVALLISIKKLFNYSDQDIKNLGRIDIKFSLVIRLFLQGLVSIEKAFKEAPKMWSKYITVGKLEVVELKKNERYLILRLSDFKLHPLHCLVLAGQFEFSLQLLFKEGITCVERKCMFKKDPYHEFLLKW